MGTSASKNKVPVTRHGFTAATAVPPPYQLAIEDTSFQLTVLDELGPHDHDCDYALVPPAWFSVTVTASTKKRYLYLVQKETTTGVVVLILLFDRAAAAGHSDGLRIPSSGGWLRAIVNGAVYVLASDLVLNHKSITAWIGGHDPPTSPAQPPYT